MNKETYLNQRKNLMTEAENALNEGNLEVFNSKKSEVDALDEKFDNFAKAQANLNAMKDNQPIADEFVNGGEKMEGPKNKVLEAENRGKALKANNAVTVGSSSIVVPKYFGENINPTFNQVSSLLDRVKIRYLQGGESFRQAYLTGYGTGGYTTEGTDYTTAEPTFGYVDINKTKITAYAEDSEEVLKLPAADYDAVVVNGIKTAIRRQITQEILVGAGGANQLVGLFSAVVTNTSPNTGPLEASKDLEITAIDKNTLDNIIYSHGGVEDVEDESVLILSKEDLRAFAMLRGTDDRKLYDVVHNGNTGTINGVQYIIHSGCKPISSTSTTNGQFSMAYGPLSNYELVVFSDIDIQRSTDFQFKKGMIAHRGSVFVGGNVVAKNGFLRIKKKVVAG